MVQCEYMYYNGAISSYIPKIYTATWAFWGLSGMRDELLKDSDMGHVTWFRFTGQHDNWAIISKLDGAKLLFLKIDM